MLERVNAGLAAARARGVKFGRSSTLSDSDRECALNLDLTLAQVAKKIGVSRRRVYRLRTFAEHRARDATSAYGNGEGALWHRIADMAHRCIGENMKMI